MRPPLVKRLQNAVSSLTNGAVPEASLDASPAEAAVAAPVDPAVTGEPAEYDPLRDGPLRYLGYSNEVSSQSLSSDQCCSAPLVKRMSFCREALVARLRSPYPPMLVVPCGWRLY